MSTNDNSDKAKSKIEQIRLDLEKKLAALEKAKLQTSEIKPEEILKNEEVEQTSKEEGASKDISNEEENSITKSFVDQISNIEKSNIQNVDASTEEDTLFEISDEIETVEEEVITEEEITEEKEKIANVVPPPSKKINFDEIESENSFKTEKNVEIEDVADVEDIPVEEEEKKSKLNLLIYALLTILLFVVGYFAMDYMKGKNSLDDEKTKKILSEYENRRYQDSIRLLDAEKRLEEFESQKYIDSIANADRIQLATNNTGLKNNNKPKANKWSRDNINKAKTTKPDDTKSVDNSIVTTSADKDNSVVTNTPVENVIDNTNKAETPPAEVAKTEEVIKEKKPEKPSKKVETLTTIEVAPVYPGCAGSGNETAKKRCMISKINKFVNRRFNAGIAQDLGLKSGVHKINVKFIIDKNGYVNVTRVRASHPELKKEAMRVVNKLPKMVPAKKDGKTTKINYFLPIIFNVE